MASDEWFQVEGIIVGWLDTSDEDNESIFEGDVAVVQTEHGFSYVRWLGNDWAQIDPPPKETTTSSIEQVPAIGMTIRFNTCHREQMDYTRIARGQDPE